MAEPGPFVWKKAVVVMAAATVAVCAPAMYLLSRYLPQLMGRPKVNGPLLKNLI